MNTDVYYDAAAITLSPEGTSTEVDVVKAKKSTSVLHRHCTVQRRQSAVNARHYPLSIGKLGDHVLSSYARIVRE